jgi:hypothetical protein
MIFDYISYFNKVLALVYKPTENDQVFENHKIRLEKIKEFLVAFRKRFPTSGKHLMFGTDWIMVGNAEGFPEFGRTTSNQRYTDRVTEFLSDAGYSEDIGNILFHNAVQFLGLGVEDRERGTRGRLEKFYRSAGVNADWLREFD